MNTTQDSRIVVITGGNGAAQALAQRLRDHGFPVEAYGQAVSASAVQGGTRTGPQLLQDLASVMNVGVVSRRFINQMTGRPFKDATVGTKTGRISSNSGLAHRVSRPQGR